ncbi:hypothetical protein I203_103187 [Kwoniella mangroviensis CBS 8507]|uniref:uncharacterized protein n=1 Tax=Kwoniella mangroviensis CBS 8507 TaxID=1296122 RepID=UPI00303DCFE4
MVITTENAFKVLQGLGRTSAFAITPQVARCFRTGKVAEMQEWERSKKSRDVDEDVKEHRSEKEREQLELLAEISGEDVVMEEGNVEERLDAKGRPLIDITKIKVGHTAAFDKSFRLRLPARNPYSCKAKLFIQHNHVYVNFSKRVKKQNELRVPEGLLSEHAIQLWYDCVKSAMNVLLVAYPDDIGPSKYPHPRWSADLASQIVMNRLPEQVDPIALGMSTIRRRAPIDPTVSFDTVQLPNISYYSAVKTVNITLPRRTQIYPGAKEFSIQRGLQSFREDHSPTITSPQSSILGQVRVNSITEQTKDPKERSDADRAVGWFKWLCYEVGLKGRMGMSYDQWMKLFLDELPRCLRDNVQSQQRRMDNRHFTVHPDQKDKSKLQLVAVRSNFMRTDTYSVHQLGIQLTGMDAATAAKFSLWINERYMKNRDVALTLIEFAHHVDTVRGYKDVWQSATDCSHRFLDGSHLCVECEKTMIPCLSLIPGRGALCGSCLEKAILQSNDEYLQTCSEILKTARQDTGGAAMLLSAISKHDGYRRRAEALKDKGYLQLSNVLALQATVRSWEDSDRDIKDAVLGLGGLGKRSEMAGHDNVLMRPSVVRRNRAYVESGSTYLLHEKDVLPTIAAIGIMSATNSLAATILVSKATKIAQSRWEDLIADQPSEEAQKLQDSMRKIEMELEALNSLQLQIPYRISGIAQTEPAILAGPLQSLEEQLEGLLIPQTPQSE